MFAKWIEEDGRFAFGVSADDDTVEITSEEHASLFDGQAKGKVIARNDDGYPMLADPPALTPEQLQQKGNANAREYLASTDWYVIRNQETGQEIPQEILNKRAEARAAVK